MTDKEHLNKIQSEYASKRRAAEKILTEVRRIREAVHFSVSIIGQDKLCGLLRETHTTIFEVTDAIEKLDKRCVIDVNRYFEDTYNVGRDYRELFDEFVTGDKIDVFSVAEYIEKAYDGCENIAEAGADALQCAVAGGVLKYFEGVSFEGNTVRVKRQLAHDNFPGAAISLLYAEKLIRALNYANYGSAEITDYYFGSDVINYGEPCGNEDTTIVFEREGSMTVTFDSEEKAALFAEIAGMKFDESVQERMGA